MLNLQQAWYNKARWPLLLYPLSLLYAAVVALRRLAYQVGWLRQHQVGVPVIVVGNISVGGTGKTPLVISLVKHLKNAGWRPGIVSRGYGGRAQTWPQSVTVLSDPFEVGDEPVLLAMNTDCPVAVAPDRVAAAKSLVARGVDIIVADDGLQHYALARDVEIAVRDGERGYGNGMLLPAGPLRESLHRLREVDLEWVNGNEGNFALHAGDVCSVNAEATARPLSDFTAGIIHAVAGIGYPQRFFNMLRAQGLEIVEHEFPDHYRYRSQDIVFKDEYEIMMTAKDAVKCRKFAGTKHWYVPVHAEIGAQALQQLDKLMKNLGKIGSSQ